MSNPKQICCFCLRLAGNGSLNYRFASKTYNLLSNCSCVTFVLNFSKERTALKYLLISRFLLILLSLCCGQNTIRKPKQ
jgi:hypothetical protein